MSTMMSGNCVCVTRDTGDNWATLNLKDQILLTSNLKNIHCSSDLNFKLHFT